MAPAAKESESKDEVKVTKAEKRKKSDGNPKSEKIEQPREKQIKKDKEREEVVPTVDIYGQMLTLENEESETRSGDADLKMWKDTCGELRSLMKDIFEMKIKNGAQSDVTEKRIQATLLFVTLKKLNRIEKLR